MPPWGSRSSSASRRGSIAPLEAFTAAAGVLGIVAVYVPILTPHNVQHDARWYHLPIAEQFAATGRGPTSGQGSRPTRACSCTKTACGSASTTPWSSTRRSGKQTLWEMPRSRPSPSPMGDALVLTCNQSMPPGLYSFAAIRERQPLVTVAAKADARKDLVDRATLIVLEDDCGFNVASELLGDFKVLATRGAVTYHQRSRVSGDP